MNLFSLVTVVQAPHCPHQNIQVAAVQMGAKRSVHNTNRQQHGDRHSLHEINLHDHDNDLDLEELDWPGAAVPRTRVCAVYTGSLDLC